MFECLVVSAAQQSPCSFVGTGILSPQRRRGAYSVVSTRDQRGFFGDHIEARGPLDCSGGPLCPKTLCEAKVEMRLNDSPNKFANNLRRPCSRCGKPLMLTRIEPANPGFDLRVYYCAHCGDHDTIISATAAP
jgi:hypothetical protein